jgi:hypothetical protein
LYASWCCPKSHACMNRHDGTIVGTAVSWSLLAQQHLPTGPPNHLKHPTLCCYRVSADSRTRLTPRLWLPRCSSPWQQPDQGL